MNQFISFNSSLSEIESSYQFTNIDEEIRYFKYEKPGFQKYGIFYNTLVKLELNVPMGSLKIKAQYYENALDQVNRTFIDNQDFIVYYRLKSTDKDAKIFTKDSPNNHIFALIEATSMMEDFLHRINDPRSIDEKINDYPKLTWTGKLSELVVLVRALVISGRINNGQATIKDVINYVQVMFNVDLKDYHRKYHDVKSSQNPTKFLDYLSEVVNDDIDQMDEKTINQKKR